VRKAFWLVFMCGVWLEEWPGLWKFSIFWIFYERGLGFRLFVRDLIEVGFLII
jgi:hypothetical protein